MEQKLWNEISKEIKATIEFVAQKKGRNIEADEEVVSMITAYVITKIKLSSKKYHN